MNHDDQAAGQELNLAALLNILWRRRLIVLGLPALGLIVGLLYGAFGTRRWEATVAIRPGITAFSPDGGPVRHWQLKDITRWYEKRLYQRDLRERLGLPSRSQQVIQAEFIAQGLQNLQGGDVITLWTTATSPELAAAILDTSLALFCAYAEADSVSSQVKLTRDGLLLQMRHLDLQLQGLAAEQARLDLQIAAAMAESLQVLADDQRLGLDLERLTRQRQYQEHRLEAFREEEPRLAADLTQLDLALRRLAAGLPDREDAAQIPTWVRRDAVLDGGTVLESLTRAKLQVQQALHENRAGQDSMAYAAATSALEHAKLEIQRETTVRTRLREAGRKLGDLRIERDLKLPDRRQDLRNDLDERRLKLATLSPLQRVGTTVVSDRPVRPRLARAIIILVLLGGTTGVVLGFVWDYVQSHRREIFRS